MTLRYQLRTLSDDPRYARARATRFENLSKFEPCVQFSIFRLASSVRCLGRHVEVDVPSAPPEAGVDWGAIYDIRVH
jgi:hypothetical protein